MNDRLAFLRAIRADPDDDTARLAFADWLDEHDDPLGAFVRVQLELEPIRYHIDNPRAVELHRCEDELLSAHRDTWLGKAKKIGTNWPEFGPQFRRGLPNHASLSLDTFLEHGEALFAACPTLREVSIFGIVNRCAELAACPHLAKLDTLEIADWPTADDAKVLVASPHIKEIPHFKLWLGGEPWVFDELLDLADKEWPRGIELVDLFDARLVYSERDAVEAREDADSYPKYANETLERNVAYLSRPFEQLFPLDGDLGYGITTAASQTVAPPAAAGNFENWVLVIFQGDGHVAKVTSRPVAIGRDDGDNFGVLYDTLQQAVAKWMDETLGLKAELIWVKEFRTGHGLSLRLWSDPRSLADPRPNPPDQYTHQSEWQARGGDARCWYEHRNFVIHWGNTYHADWRGSIHSS